MICKALPAALLLIGTFGTSLSAENTLNLPEMAPDKPLTSGLPICENKPHDLANCVRVLACIGDQGLWFDGQAHGWDEGQVLGVMSSGVPCAGTWTSRGFLGTGHSQITCEDGTTAGVIYYSQDNETGTVIGSGTDNHDRRLKVWSGEHVLRFLHNSKTRRPELPCEERAIPVS